MASLESRVQQIRQMRAQRANRGEPANMVIASLRKSQGLSEAADPSKLWAISDMNSPDWLVSALNLLDMTGDGVLDEEELTSALSKMKKHEVSVKENSPVFDYTQLPEPVRDALAFWDSAGSGTVHVSELITAAEAQMEMTKANRNSKWTAVLGLLILVAFPLLNFLMSYVALESTKDMKLSATGRLTTSDAAARRTLQDLAEADLTNTDNLVATQSGSTQGYLSSTMSNEDLRELRSITISAGANTANAGFIELEVVSRLREETVTAKCGSVVHLDTVAGRVTLDDTSIFLSPEVLDAVTSSMGTDAARRLLTEQGHAAGRRLSSASDVVGFFNKLSHTKYECASVERPAMNFLNYKYTARVDYPCDELQGCTSDLANYLGVGYLPGVFETETGEHRIAVEQTGWVFGDETITKSKYPNHPLQELWMLETPLYRISFQAAQGALVHCNKVHRGSEFDEEGSFRMLRKLAGQMNQVSQEDMARQLQELQAEQENDLYIQFVGRSVDYSLLDDGVPIRKFKIRAKNDAIAAEKNIPPAEYWDRDVAGNHVPYRMMVGGDTLERTVTATTFSEITELDEETWMDIRGEIPDDLGEHPNVDPRCSKSGKDLRLADTPGINTPGEERLTSVQWYYEYFFRDFRHLSSENGTKAKRVHVGAMYGDYWMNVYGHDDQKRYGDNAFMRYMSEKLSVPVEELARGYLAVPNAEQPIVTASPTVYEDAVETNLDTLEVGEEDGTIRRRLHPWEVGPANAWTPFEEQWNDDSWGARAYGSWLERGTLWTNCATNDQSSTDICGPSYRADFRWGVAGTGYKQYHGCYEFVLNTAWADAIFNKFPMAIYICSRRAVAINARYHEGIVPDNGMHPSELDGLLRATGANRDEKPWWSGAVKGKLWYVKVEVKCGSTSINPIVRRASQTMRLRQEGAGNVAGGGGVHAGCVFGSWVVTCGFEGGIESGIEQSAGSAYEDCGDAAIELGDTTAYVHRGDNKGCSNGGAINSGGRNGSTGGTQRACEQECNALSWCVSYSWSKVNGWCLRYTGDCKFSNHSSWNSVRGRYDSLNKDYVYLQHGNAGWSSSVRARHVGHRATQMACELNCDDDNTCHSYAYHIDGIRCFLADGISVFDSNRAYWSKSDKKPMLWARQQGLGEGEVGFLAIGLTEPAAAGSSGTVQAAAAAPLTTCTSNCPPPPPPPPGPAACVMVQPAYTNVGITLFIGLVRDLSLYKDPRNCMPQQNNCSTYVGCYVGLKFQITVSAGGSTEEGAQGGSMAFRVTIAFGLTVFGGCNARIKGHDLANIEISAQIILYFKVYILKRYHPASCQRGLYGNAAQQARTPYCKLLRALFDESDWFQLDVEGNFYASVRLTLGPIMLHGRVDCQVYGQDIVENQVGIDYYWSIRAWSPGVNWGWTCGLDFRGTWPVTRCGFDRPGITWRLASGTNFDKKVCLAGDCPPGFDPRRRVLAAPESMDDQVKAAGQMAKPLQADEARSAWFLENYRRTEQELGGARRMLLAQVEESFGTNPSHQDRVRILEEYYRQNADPFQDPTLEDSEDIYQPLVASRGAKLVSLKALTSQFRK